MTDFEKVFLDLVIYRGMDFGEFLSYLLKKTGKTVKEISELSEIPESTIYRIISGKRKDPQLSTVRRIILSFSDYKNRKKIYDKCAILMSNRSLVSNMPVYCARDFRELIRTAVLCDMMGYRVIYVDALHDLISLVVSCEVRKLK
mgnify:CR=1 FL=1